MLNDMIANDSLAAIKWAVSFAISNYESLDSDGEWDTTLEQLEKAEQRLAPATQVTITATT